MFPVDSVGFPLFYPIKKLFPGARYRLVATSAATAEELETAEALVLLWDRQKEQLKQLQALFPAETLEPCYARHGGFVDVDGDLLMLIDLGCVVMLTDLSFGWGF